MSILVHFRLPCTLMVMIPCPSIDFGALSLPIIGVRRSHFTRCVVQRDPTSSSAFFPVLSDAVSPLSCLGFVLVCSSHIYVHSFLFFFHNSGFALGLDMFCYYIRPSSVVFICV